MTNVVKLPVYASPDVADPLNVLPDTGVLQLGEQNKATVTVTSAITVAAPDTMIEGADYAILFVQDATGYAVTLDAVFDVRAGSISTTPLATSLLRGYCFQGSIICDVI
jgi:hypothetical protein